MSLTNSLVEIPIASFSTLRDKFKVDWPKHIIAFSLIDNFISRIAKNQEIAKFYSLNGDWERDGTFVVILVREFSSVAFRVLIWPTFQREREVLFATLDETLQTLTTALRLLDFSKFLFFVCARDGYRRAVDDVIRDEKLEVLFDDGTAMKYLSKEDALRWDVE